MAKSRSPTKPKPKSHGRAVQASRPTLQDWKPSPWNPRQISPKSLAGLAASLRAFGDLSGFVLNGRTGTVICGHHRGSALEEVDLGCVELGPSRRVELARRAMKCSSRHGESVLDLFGGSGFTLIAAEELGRRAFLMELDPPYCDVIVRRWEEFTGRKAKRTRGCNSSRKENS